MSQSWLSVHLYYNEPWEDFLAKTVAPYIETVLKTGIADSSFFIRYWERGPHIRLRFKGEATVLQEVLKPNLTEHFDAYFDANPSERTEPEYPDDFPPAFHWLPNNTIQFAQYVPELDRYGGSRGVSVSEEQFQLSSATVLDHFEKREDSGGYHDDLGTAIRLHLSFVYSIGFSHEEAVSFFELVFENWLPSAFEIFEDNTPEDQILEKMKEMVAVFADSFESQKGALIDFHENLWKDLNSGEDFESNTFNQWIKENRRLSRQLKEAASSNLLNSRSDVYVMSDTLEKRLSKQEALLWNIYADFVHMTNNRLGIMNQDEAYLAYLMKRSLEGEKE